MRAKASRVSRREASSGVADGSSMFRSQAVRSLTCIAQASAMEIPSILDSRAAAVGLAPSRPGQTPKVTARFTKDRMRGCMASTSLLRKTSGSLGSDSRR